MATLMSVCTVQEHDELEARVADLESRERELVAYAVSLMGHEARVAELEDQRANLEATWLEWRPVIEAVRSWCYGGGGTLMDIQVAARQAGLGGE